MTVVYYFGYLAIGLDKKWGVVILYWGPLAKVSMTKEGAEYTFFVVKPPKRNDMRHRETPESTYTEMMTFATSKFGTGAIPTKS